MKLRMYQIDAFAALPFAGNPAAVVPLDDWLGDDLMQSIASENNLSETAFFVAADSGYALRWFTPTTEVKLCGHATLATAFVLFTEIDPRLDVARFETLSGRLTVERDGDRLRMDFPRWQLEPAATVPDALLSGLGTAPTELYSVSTGDNLLAVLDDQAALEALDPIYPALASLHPAGVIVTAPGEASDCACRYFAPSYGIDEDPATGSIHCALAPFWSERLGKRRIHSKQVSRRGGDFFCELSGDRTLIAGHAVKYLEGWIDYSSPSAL